MVVNHNIFPTEYLNGNNATTKIIIFCGKFLIIKTAAFYSINEVERAAADQIC